MTYPSLNAFLKQNRDALSAGPVAMIFAEDAVELPSTLRHHLDCGFRSVLALMPSDFELPADLDARVHRITYDCTVPGAVGEALNSVIAAAPDIWMYYCFNAEYLFYPFHETRSVNEMLTFHASERRDAMLTYVIDLYTIDLDRFPDTVSLEHAYLDKSGYFALARPAPDTGEPLDRQLDFFGGMRWRFEEHIPETSRRIDRISLFRARPGLHWRPDHTFSDPEYNTYACPWHHNLTATVCSFRTAKALKRNAGSTFEIGSFRWRNSTRFEWSAQQLLDIGLMEPGQWF